MAVIFEKINWKDRIRKLTDIFFGLGEIKNFLTALVHISGCSKKTTFLYQLKNGLKFSCLNNKKNRTLLLSIKEIIGDGIYHMPSKNNDPILDLGANIGVYSLFAAQMFPNRSIYAVEPDPENFQQLENNIRLNQKNNIHPIQKAISKAEGTISLFIDAMSSRGHSIYPRSSLKIDVPSIPLEKLFQELKLDRLGLLKIDVEGAEFEILYHTPKHILDAIDAIALEYHADLEKVDPKYNIAHLCHFLVSHQFHIIKNANSILWANKQ